MWIMFIFLIAGVLIGYTAPIARYLPWNKWVTMAGLVFLLFSMGASIGRNSKLLRDFVQMGGKAIIIAVLAIVGSLVVTWIVEMKLFRAKEKK